MQLTKEDVIKAGILQEEWVIGQHDYDERLLKFSKFQQVVEFYEKYKGMTAKLSKNYPAIYVKYSDYLDTIPDYNDKTPEEDIMIFNDWLFNYCFVEGLR